MAGDRIDLAKIGLRRSPSRPINGKQVLKPETVAVMGENHMGDPVVTRLVSVAAQTTNDAEFFPGMVKNRDLAS